MEMKYIATIMEDEYDNEVEEIFIFPKTVNHDDMMEVIARIKKRLPSGGWKRLHRVPLGAGFYTPSLGCYGRSETLNLDSRGADDTALIGVVL